MVLSLLDLSFLFIAVLSLLLIFLYNSYRRLEYAVEKISILTAELRIEARHSFERLSKVEDQALSATQELGAIAKSSHRVQFIPADSASMLSELKDQMGEMGLQADPHIERLEAMIRKATDAGEIPEI